MEFGFLSLLIVELIKTNSVANYFENQYIISFASKIIKHSLFFLQDFDFLFQS